MDRAARAGAGGGDRSGVPQLPHAVTSWLLTGGACAGPCPPVTSPQPRRHRQTQGGRDLATARDGQTDTRRP